VGKGGRCVRLTTLPPSCAVVTKSGKLNFLEPSRPLEARNGTALPLPLLIQDIASVTLHWSEITFKTKPVELTCKQARRTTDDQPVLCTGRPPTGVMIPHAV